MSAPRIWLAQALLFFLTTESIELKNTSGLMFLILPRVILPSGHLTPPQGTILTPKIKCTRTAISLM
uniref:Interleukin 6 signal transducer n=1 Tax=Mus musculus TaxID=10090 RepID=V9GX73_MOUSE